MNTRLCYFYRDPCNYRTHKEVILAGHMELEDLLPYLWSETFFVPSQVGLDCLRGDACSEYDHVWHEIRSIESTEEPCTIEMDCMSFKKKVREYYEENIRSLNNRGTHPAM